MQQTRARFWYTGLWVSLALAIAAWPSSVAYAGLGAWTSGGPAGDVWALAIDPTTPATLYAGMNGGGSGVFKSTDSGATWAAASTGLTNPYVYALAINPIDPLHALRRDAPAAASSSPPTPALPGPPPTRD